MIKRAVRWGSMAGFWGDNRFPSGLERVGRRCSGLGAPGQLPVEERHEQYDGGDADEDERHVVQPGVADASVEDDAGDRRRGDRPEVAEGPREARGGPETFRR